MQVRGAVVRLVVSIIPKEVPEEAVRYFILFTAERLLEQS
jgi:hypothetical protein